MDDRITVSHDHVGNLREDASRLANEQTKIAEGMEETLGAEGVLPRG